MSAKNQELYLMRLGNRPLGEGVPEWGLKIKHFKVFPESC